MMQLVRDAGKKGSQKSLRLFLVGDERDISAEVFFREITDDVGDCVVEFEVRYQYGLPFAVTTNSRLVIYYAFKF